MKSKEIKSLQAARGIAALLVVICHSAAFIGEEPGLWQKTPLYTWLRGTALGVQLFFVISGIVIFRAHRKDFNQPRNVGMFYWKRFRRIYPLYWICFSLTLLKHLKTTNPEASYQRFPSVIVSNYLLFHLFSYQSIMVQAWTLFDEIQFYLIFSICIFSRRAGFALLGTWFVASLFFLTPSSPYWSVMLSPYHLLFGLGILVAFVLDTDKRVPAGLVFWLGAAIFAGAVIMGGPISDGVFIRLVGGVGAAGILLGAALMERRKGLNVPRWLIFLGDASYSIYLVHFMVISAVARFSYAHLKHLPIPIEGWMLILISFGTGMGIATYCLIERPLLGLLGNVQHRR